MTEEASCDRVTPVTRAFPSVVRNLSLYPCPSQPHPRPQQALRGGGGGLGVG